VSPDREQRRVINAYVLLSVLFTLSASTIWAINTIFLIRLGGLDLFQVMLVNTVFTVASLVFEVPTGVIADTIGRRASVLLSIVTLILSTLLYVVTPRMGWGMWGFAAASVLIGLGFTFQTGAVDAWLVDALDSCGYLQAKERVFARGQMASAVGMLVGSLLGGLLGQIDLALPYLVRAGLLGTALVAVLVTVHDEGFQPRPLKWSTFGAEARRIAHAGTVYGWRSPVIRPLLWASALGGVFFMFSFYAWQPYVLELLGRDYVWLLGVVQAGFSAATILGNTLVPKIMRAGAHRRDPARVLAATAWLDALLAVAIAGVGFLAMRPGVVPAAIAIVLWLGWGLSFGIYTPVRMGFINEHIPSSERATVLSLDAFFGDAGGAVGQPTLGWVSQKASIQLAWLIGSAFLLAVPSFYRVAGRAAEAKLEMTDQG